MTESPTTLEVEGLVDSLQRELEAGRDFVPANHPAAKIPYILHLYAAISALVGEGSSQGALSPSLTLSRPEALSPAGWRDIASAPEDGTTFIGWYCGAARIIRWGKTSHVPLYGFCLADQGPEDFDICSDDELSHWMPLPPPPAESGAADRPERSEGSASLPPDDQNPDQTP